jgi:hypothetical protein
MTLKLSNSPLEMIIDDEDYERCSRHKWVLIGHRGSRIFATIRKKSVGIGRFLLGYKGNLTIDHIDRNFLNCRKENLRIATLSQNNANKLKQPGRSSIYKGVTWNKKNKVWIAHIVVKGKFIYLGTFRIESEAGLAYNKAAIKYFKEFAVLNNIEKGENVPKCG